jgi:OPT family oligopeptide transporter
MSSEIEAKNHMVEPEAAPVHDSHSSDYDEKAGTPKAEQPEIKATDAQSELLDMYDPNVVDPFPVDPLAPVEEHQLTVRALVVGSILGAVVGASNIYLGLKTGFTFGPQLFGAIFGFAILKPLAKAIPNSGILYRMMGGDFGPKENCTVQTAATSAGGLGILFVSAIPAMYRLELLSANPVDDIGRLIALTISSAYFGLFFAIPLRRWFILRQKLVFPTPTATAFTIRSLHSGRAGAVAAAKKAKCLLYSLLGVFGFKVATGYAPGLIYDWHVGWVLYRMGGTSAIELENFGWILEFTPAFIGAGMLSGVNASWSFFGGSILSWGIIAPTIVKNGLAVGRQVSDEFPEYINYYKMTFTNPDDVINAPSPRYWLLWPGVLMMLVYSFIEIGMSSRGLLKNIGSMPSAVKESYSNWRAGIVPEDDDPAPPEDRIKPWIWMGGIVISIIIACALLATQFGVGVGETILALVLGFIFSFIGVQSAGDTDINPVSTVAKASQLVFGGVSKGQGMAQNPARFVNLVSGTLSAGAAAQGTDMVGDLKTGHLLGAKPKNQFWAQLFGTTIAAFLTVGLYVLFAAAAPCINTGETPCQYSAPSVAAWAAVASAVTGDKLPISPSAGYTAIGISIFVGIAVVVKHLFIPQKYWVYVPNWNAVGLAFVVPQLQYSIAMAFGSILSYYWIKKYPRNYDMYMFPLSAGLLAGEGLGGVFQALLAVAGVAGGTTDADGKLIIGTAIGCPINEFCG